jgi:hypothetical protein
LQHTYTHTEIHCSGDGEGKYLFEIAKTIDAKMLYPIHTEHPEIYVRLICKAHKKRKMTVVREGEAYVL